MTQRSKGSRGQMRPSPHSLQDALRGQGVDGRLVDGAVIVVEPPKRHGSGDEQRRSSQG